MDDYTDDFEKQQAEEQLNEFEKNMTDGIQLQQKSARRQYARVKAQVEASPRFMEKLKSRGIKVDDYLRDISMKPQAVNNQYDVGENKLLDDLYGKASPPPSPTVARGQEIKKDQAAGKLNSDDALLAQVKNFLPADDPIFR